MNDGEIQQHALFLLDQEHLYGNKVINDTIGMNEPWNQHGLSE